MKPTKVKGRKSKKGRREKKSSTKKSHREVGRKRKGHTRDTTKYTQLVLFSNVMNYNVLSFLFLFMFIYICIYMYIYIISIKKIKKVDYLTFPSV